MKHLMFMLIMGCLFFFQTSHAENVHHFNFILCIDEKLILGPIGMDFILVDSLSNKCDTMDCTYSIGNLEIKDEDFEKIKAADSVYIHILTQNRVCDGFEYNLKCHAKFYDTYRYIIQIFNLDKEGTKYDYGYYGNFESSYFIHFFLANPNRKKNLKRANKFINW